MEFLRLPVITVVGVLLYAEPLSAAILIGAGVIIAPTSSTCAPGPAGPRPEAPRRRRTLSRAVHFRRLPA
jgi:hypothetical protein